jgi:hypothetical protein
MVFIEEQLKAVDGETPEPRRPLPEWKDLSDDRKALWNKVAGDLNLYPDWLRHELLVKFYREIMLNVRPNKIQFPEKVIILTFNWVM